MAKKLDQIMAALPAKRRGKIEARAAGLATLKDLRQAVAQTQEELAATLGVGQDTISRLETLSLMSGLALFQSDSWIENGRLSYARSWCCRDSDWGVDF